MSKHQNITTFDEFVAKHEEVKEQWRKLPTGTLLVCQCNFCERTIGLDHFNNHRAWQQYTTRCGCNKLDKSIVTRTKHVVA